MNNIKVLRKEKNLTQTELAIYLGVDQTTVSKWELNKALPDTLMLINLAEYFDVSIDYLLSRSTYYFPDEIESTLYLAPEEIEIIDCYRELNNSGQQLIRDTIRTLHKVTNNKIENKNSNGEKI